MKNILSYEYKYKKLIADNLQDMINKRYMEISDEEYVRVNNAIDQYKLAIEEIRNQLNYGIFTEEQETELERKLRQLEADIKALKADTFYVDETGLYFTDDEGKVGAKLDSTGFHTMGEVSKDLSIVNY